MVDVYISCVSEARSDKDLQGPRLGKTKKRHVSSGFGIFSSFFSVVLISATQARAVPEPRSGAKAVGEGGGGGGGGRGGRAVPLDGTRWTGFTR